MSLCIGFAASAALAAAALLHEPGGDDRVSAVEPAVESPTRPVPGIAAPRAAARPMRGPSRTGDRPAAARPPATVAGGTGPGPVASAASPFVNSGVRFDARPRFASGALLLAGWHRGRPRG